jgi:serine/threonine protein kinase
VDNDNFQRKFGQAGFLAPELFKETRFDEKIDVFSLGVVFYILVFGKQLFDGRTYD